MPSYIDDDLTEDLVDTSQPSASASVVKDNRKRGRDRNKRRRHNSPSPATSVKKKGTCKRIASSIREQRDEFERRRDEMTRKVRALATRGARREAKLVPILLGLQGVQEQDLRGLDQSQAAY